MMRSSGFVLQCLAKHAFCAGVVDARLNARRRSDSRERLGFLTPGSPSGQVRASLGTNKKCKQKGRRAYLLFHGFSLGDEMYRWARVNSLKSFLEGIEEEYRCVSNGNKLATARTHLLEDDVAPFNGKRALREATKELEKRRKEFVQKQQERRFQQDYRAAHGLIKFMCSRVAVFVRACVCQAIASSCAAAWQSAGTAKLQLIS